MVSAFRTVEKILTGPGSVEQLAEEVKRLGSDRTLLVTDKGLKEAGVVDAVCNVMEKAGVKYRVYDGVEPEPEARLVNVAVKVGKEFGASSVVGLGGGSSLDVAKAAAVMMTNEGSVEDYFGMEKIRKPGLPVVAVPTTAGTGSEVTSISVLMDPSDGVKKGVVSSFMYAKVAILDPTLTVNLPPRLTAMTGLDALVHAIESFTGVNANPITDALNAKSIELIAANIRKAVFSGHDLAARDAMLTASCMAGMAFSNTQNGLDHALALAIGSRYHLSHGLSTAILLPWVMAFNLPANLEKFARIARIVGKPVEGADLRTMARLAVDWAKELLEDLNVLPALRAYGVRKEDFPLLAKQALAAKRLIDNNPRRPSEEEVVTLLEEAY
jgi:alcohol dehydrogenase